MIQSARERREELGSAEFREVNFPCVAFSAPATVHPLTRDICFVSLKTDNCVHFHEDDTYEQVFFNSKDGKESFLSPAEHT